MIEDGYISSRNRPQALHDRSEMTGGVVVGNPMYHTGPDIAFLPHSCNEWVIGDADDVRSLISDLTAALERLTRKEQT